MRLRNSLGLSMVGLLVVTMSSAQEPPVAGIDRTKLPPINVSNAILNALEKHPQSRISEENLNLAEQDVASARSDLIPNMSTSYNFSYQHNPVQIGLGQAQVGVAGVSLGQMIFNLPAVHGYRSAQERLKAATETSENDRLRIAAQSTSTYVDLLKLRITLDLAAENYDFLNRLVESMKTGNLSGKAKPADIQLAEGYLGSAISEKHIWKGEAYKMERNFYRDSRLSPAQYFLIEPEGLSVPEDAEAAVARAIENNPALAASRFSLSAAGSDVKATRSAFLPRVDGYVSAYNVKRPQGDFNEFHRSGWMAGVNVTVPIFDRKRGATAAAAKIRERRAELQLEDLTVNLGTNIYNLYIQTSERQIRLKALCPGLQKRREGVRALWGRVLDDVSIQDLLVQRTELLKTAISLNNEFLAEALDSYSVHVQMGTLLENIPAPTDKKPNGDNPHLRGDQAYDGLLKRCKDRGYIQ